MRSTIVFLLFTSFLAAQQQPDLWSHVDPAGYLPRLQPATLSKVQERAIAQLLLPSILSDLEGSEGDKPEDIPSCLTLEQIPLAPRQNVLLAEGDRECGFEMWFIRLDGDRPVLLAPPQPDYNGGLYSIQPAMTHGYHDFVLGWHMSARETTLTYFRFNGKSYDSVSKAADLCDEGGKCKVNPNID